MNYEFNDFRNKRTSSWTNWKPKELGWDYIVKMFLFLFGILLFGAAICWNVNVIIIDYFIYILIEQGGCYEHRFSTCRLRGLELKEHITKWVVPLMIQKLDPNITMSAGTYNPTV